MSLLVLDVGNSTVHVGVLVNGEIKYHWRIPSESSISVDDCVRRLQLHQAAVAKTPITAAIASIVSPQFRKTILNACERSFGVTPVEVNAQILAPLQPTLYNPPSDLGADRVVNALAARKQLGQPCIVVDVGTAITFDVISPEGIILGGSILPGPITALEGLLRRAPHLPTITLETPPAGCIASSTRSNLQSGLVYGFASLIQAMLVRIRHEMGSEIPAIATGGLAQTLAPYIEGQFCVDPLLTLRGLEIAAQAIGIVTE